MPAYAIGCLTNVRLGPGVVAYLKGIDATLAFLPVLAVVAVEDDRHPRAAFAGGGVFENLCGVITAAVVD